MMKRAVTGPFVLGSLLALVGAACGGAGEDVAVAQSSATAATQAQTQRRGPDPARMLARFDRNGDGRTEVSELPPFLQERMGEADTNHDGALTVAELDAHMATRRAAHFQRLDANHDGAVTADEAGGRWARLGQADLNRDGRVTAEELTAAQASGVLRPPPGEGHGHGDPAQRLARFDRNGDGRIEVSELPVPLQTHLGAADVNHDGVIAPDEATAFAAQRRAQGLRGWRGGHHGEGPGAPEGMMPPPGDEPDGPDDFAPVAPVAPVAPAAPAVR